MIGWYQSIQASKAFLLQGKFLGYPELALQAFSLIELSIVILIIGILIAGVSQSSVLISKMRLSSARTQAESSPVPSISNLVTWLETTSEKSFIESETENLGLVSTWYDINTNSSKKNNATSSGVARPTYKTKCINDLPCLNFITNDAMDSTLNLGMADGVSIFIVITYNNAASITACCQSIISTNGAWAANSMQYFASDRLIYATNGNADVAGSASKLVASRNLILAVVDNGATVTNYSNGAISGSATSIATGKKSLNGLNIGYWNLGGSTSRYLANSYVGEIIVFDRGLKSEERQAVISYLGKKWGIATS